MKIIVKLLQIQLCAVLSVALVLCTTSALFAQGIDVSAPVIKHTAVDSAVSGDNILIEAEVTDNISVVSVVLHYRFKGETAFQEIPMGHEGGVQYAALVPTELNIETELEYYIEAEDAGGTKTTRGLSFDPLSISISSQETQEPVEAGTTESPLFAETTLPQSEAPVVPKPKSKKLWYVAGGVLLLGIAAASLGGSSDTDTGGTACAAQGCLVVFTVDPI